MSAAPCPARPDRRTYAVVDAENLAYDDRVPPQARVAVVRAALATIDGTWWGDAAVAHRTLHHRLVFADITGLRIHRVPDEADAADRDLLDRLAHDLPCTVDRVVVVSGDHAFAPAVRALRARGLPVTVIGLAGNIHHSLYAACPDVVALDPTDLRDGTPAAAAA